MAAPYQSLARRLRWPGLLLASVVVYGVVGYLVMGWSFLDALYMTLMTVTTVGYGEVRPLDTVGKVFTSSLIVFGVTLLFVSVAVAAAWVAEGTISAYHRRRRMERSISRMRDHYILCAFGRVGRAVAREFKEEGVPFVVVESDEDLEERMIEEGVEYLVDDPSQEEVLRAAGIEDARGLVCAVDSDATNVYITLIARSVNPDIFIVARASESASIERLRKAGANRVISPYVTSGHHMAIMALRPGVVGSLDIVTPSETGLSIEEIYVEDGSALVGQTAGAVCGSASLLAIRHPDGQVTANPRGNTALRPGDVLILLGGEDELRAIRGG